VFLKNHWYIAATVDEVGRKLSQRWILGEPVLMYRTEGGVATALHNACPHRSMPLSEGKLVGDEVQCAYHGLRVGADGKCIHIPGQGSIPPRAGVRTFPLVEKWRWLWIWMGDPDKADEASIPDFHWNDDPKWTPTGGRFHINCDYQLLVDNLLDLSHEAFVHPTTIGNLALVDTAPRTETRGEAVRVMRQINGHPPPPLYAKLKDFKGNIDRTQNIEWTPPSNIVIESRSSPSGSNDPEMILEYRVLNGITPASRGVTHHFWAVPRNFAPEPEVTEAFHEGSVRAFSEDVEVLEKQQAMIEHLGDAPEWMNIKVDEGGIMARRRIKQLLEEEMAAEA
jgi:vanillate O-demethylase monooxygenase subunit